MRLFPVNQRYVRRGALRIVDLFVQARVASARAPRQDVMHRVDQSVERGFLGFFFFPRDLVFKFALIVAKRRLYAVTLCFRGNHTVDLFSPLAVRPFTRRIARDVQPTRHGDPLSKGSFLRNIGSIFRLSATVHLDKRDEYAGRCAWERSVFRVG